VKAAKIDVTCEEDPLKEFRILETLKAIGRGFSPEKALELLEDDMLMLEVIDLSDVANTPKELQRIKGRIIGRNGRTRELAENPDKRQDLSIRKKPYPYLDTLNRTP